MANFNQKTSKGFTLIEIMVALVIFAVLSIALLTRLGSDLRSEQLLEEKTLASMVAENTLTEMRVNKDGSSVSGGRSSVELAGKKWEVVTTVKSTNQENLQQVDVQVQPVSNKRGASYLLTGFIGKH
ncbi:MAG: type II secretion system minor pseudopilin GspI [Pseudomonadales bacterium]